MKVIKISPKISAKTMLMIKPIILTPNSRKTKKRQNVVGFGSKILKFCLRIQIFVQMSEKEVLFAKFVTMILNVVKCNQNEPKCI